ncbi:hypothetical protein MK079_04500 [Candidatus Gracilibacteria bacterium]|nr:hypothetical protein [Candidatus Gracilibacteria bacterium]
MGPYFFSKPGTNFTYKNTLFIPVPLHFLKKIKRGYNQSFLLADGLSETTGIPCRTDIIYRKKYTRQQSHLGKKERQENIKNAFVINKKYTDILDKKHIILVDDVVSTGATLNEIKNIIKQQSSPLSIHFCCIASGR